MRPTIIVTVRRPGEAYVVVAPAGATEEAVPGAAPGPKVQAMGVPAGTETGVNTTGLPATGGSGEAVKDWPYAGAAATTMTPRVASKIRTRSAYYGVDITLSAPIGTNRTCAYNALRRVYDRFVRARTNMNLDRELVADAADVLGTHGATETVHAAMAEVVRAARLRRLAARDLPDLTPNALTELRRSRTAS